jgi:hypothetical protein
MGTAQGPGSHREPPGPGAVAAGGQAPPAPGALRRGPGRARVPPQRQSLSTKAGSPSSVWEPACAKLFPRRPDLAAGRSPPVQTLALRRHDLRHAACSWWLREGVDAVVCQRWSGHRTLSVFLDIYQGVAPGSRRRGVQRLEQHAMSAPRSSCVPPRAAGQCLFASRAAGRRRWRSHSRTSPQGQS